MTKPNSSSAGPAPRLFPIWELVSIPQIGALGMWLVSQRGAWGGVAAALSVVTVILAARQRRPARVAVSVLSLAGAGAAFHASWQVAAVEERWEEVHESLVNRASQRLQSTLGNAVATVEALAIRGSALSAPSRAAAFALLEGGLAGRTPERAIVVFDEEGRPWAWAGNARVSVAPDGPELMVRITPFYVVLEARVRGDSATAVAQVVLAADSAIPRREGTVAARFERATGSGLEFFAPPEAPYGGDLFNYCLPICNALDVVPDTLLIVRPVPPSQGTLKLRLLDRGGLRVSIAMAAAVVVLGLVGASWLRWVALGGGAILLVLTPVGQRLGLTELFSSRTYFSSIGGWSATAGQLIVWSSFVLLVLGALWGLRARVRVLLVPSVVGVLLLPAALRYLAGGITPPGAGISLSNWIGWSVTIATACTAILLAAGFGIRVATERRAHRAAPWLAGAWAVVLALTGLLSWTPGGWGIWFGLAWIPAFALAVAPVSRRSLLLSSAVVSGIAASLVTWGAVVDGRLLLAERDVQRFGPDPDPLPMGVLEVMGADLGAGPIPATSAELYKLWSRSALSREGYPVNMITWDPRLAVSARLDLARLDLTTETLRVLARAASDRSEPTLEDFTKVPGVHYVLSVPYPDGSVVTVALGPRSRAVPQMRIARFLQGEAFGAAPYEMVVSDLQPPAGASDSLSWRRDRFAIRGEQRFEVVGGHRHLHIVVALGRSVSNTLIRGALFTLLNCAVVLSLWVAGEVIAGRRSPQSWALAVWGGSYRGRLALALGGFFLVPMVGFAVWGAGRLRSEVDRAQDLVIQQTLQDAAGEAASIPVARGPRARERLDDLARRLDIDLLMYENGQLVHASTPVLAELALVGPYMGPDLYRRLVLEDDLEAVADRVIGAQRARVGYRTLVATTGVSRVLAEPRLAGDTPVFADFDTLMLATILGIIAALWLAAKAAESLARPVQALSMAAEAVGRGKPVPSFDPGTPKEFVPVVNAFERMARDVRAHQQALEEALQFTGAVLDNVATGVVTLDRDLRVTTANPRAVALLGGDPVSYQEVTLTTPAEWLPVWQWVREFMEGGLEVDATEFTLGDRRIRAQVAALTTVDGGCVVALDDATELAMAERVLAWGEMARQVAHEIKNPLTPIRLGIQHIQRSHQAGRGDFAATLDKTGQQILAEIERLDAIARAFSRFGAPPVAAEPVTDVNLAEVAEEAAALYGLSGEPYVRVISENSRRSRLRRDELKEVLINLIENARGARATEVTIEIKPYGSDCTALVVRDDGSGIPPEDVTRIFEPHFSTNTSGTGLGLAICKRLVESWGGSISAESEVGKGTTVSLCLQ